MTRHDDVVLDEQARSALVVARRERGWSVRAAASAAGVSNTTWGRLEGGDIAVTPNTRAAVASAFGWSSDWPENPPATPQPDDDVRRRVERLERVVTALARQLEESLDVRIDLEIDAQEAL